MNREDFNILKTDLIYFDNAATSLKPDLLSEVTKDYYMNYPSNINRGDYNISTVVNQKYEETRLKVKDYINANSKEEIVFTSGTTESLNMIIFGFMKDYLKPGDEVILTKAEHASNVLPWLVLQKEIGIKLVYADLEYGRLTINNLEKIINDKTKVISIAHITNVLGDERPLKEISDLIKDKNILLVVDAAQSSGHIKLDVTDLEIDFLVFSAHKMLGPTGVGILYGKKQLLEQLKPNKYGGGMNDIFDEENYMLYPLPTRLEGGTPNIAGVIAFGAIIDYLNNLDLHKINNYVKDLRWYLIEKLKTIDKVIIYNESIEGSIVTFNIEGLFAQDVAIYLNKYNVAIRSGNHCAKLLAKEIEIKNTCRVSLYFYNTKEEIDKFIDILSNHEQVLKTII